jgi:PilZ domain
MRLARQDRMAMMRRDDRRHSRHPVLWPTMVTAEDSFDRYVLNGKIRNISVSGVHVLVEKAIDPGCQVTLRIDRVGTFCGQVAWCEDGRIGVAFDAASKAVVELMLARLPMPAEPYDQF